MKTYTTPPPIEVINRAGHVIKDDDGWHVFESEAELRDTGRTPKRFRDVLAVVELVRAERGG